MPLPLNLDERMAKNYTNQFGLKSPKPFLNTSAPSVTMHQNIMHQSNCSHVQVSLAMTKFDRQIHANPRRQDSDP